ncbi:hypothetical protein [Halocatena marina]|uniref:Uncharacterized protein n=1 Tax=Halocatena marina TaxID=2934937 RepID=A0ABD5YU51_9EURY|nr:hypothetical protein [Halocatena marina]
MADGHAQVVAGEHTSMASTNILSELLGSIPQLIQEFAGILQASSPQAVLLIVGGLFVTFSVVIMGYLTAGALLRPIGGLPSQGRSYGRQGRGR